MSAPATLRSSYPGLARRVGRPGAALRDFGDHVIFYGKALAATPFAVANYRREVIRLIAEISMGAGTLAMIGGTVVIVGFLTLATGGYWRYRVTALWATSASRR